MCALLWSALYENQHTEGRPDQGPEAASPRAEKCHQRGAGHASKQDRRGWTDSVPWSIVGGCACNGKLLSGASEARHPCVIQRSLSRKSRVKQLWRDCKVTRKNSLKVERLNKSKRQAPNGKGAHSVQRQHTVLVLVCSELGLEEISHP